MEPPGEETKPEGSPTADAPTQHGELPGEGSRAAGRALPGLRPVAMVCCEEDAPTRRMSPTTPSAASAEQVTPVWCTRRPSGRKTGSDRPRCGPVRDRPSCRNILWCHSPHFR